MVALYIRNFSMVSVADENLRITDWHTLVDISNVSKPHDLKTDENQSKKRIILALYRSFTKSIWLK